MNNKQDRRTQRTRHLLSAALVELIREKDYSAITVSDIIERANVGRSTFYSHYQDKDDLFVGEMDRVIDALSQRIPDQSEFPFFPSRGLFQHVGEEFQLYKSLVWTPGIDLLMKHMQRSLSQRIEQGLLENMKGYEVPIPILASFIAGSFLTLLKWWLENKMTYTPAQMDDIFTRLIQRGVETQN